jgi:hypothetical protein
VRVSRHFGLGPFLWRSIDEAEATARIDQTAWQRGVADAAAAVDNNRSIYSVVGVVVFAVVGVFVGPGPLIARIVLAAAAGFVVAWLVPTGMAAVIALDAPRRQRNEARAYAAAWEEHAQGRDVWEW